MIVRVLLVALVLAVVVAPRGARAEDGASAARAHFQKAEAAFNMGDFEGALASYQAAYKAKPLPGLLFNVGQCHRNMGNHERALFFYRRYLALSPDTPNRSLVEGLIAEEEKKEAASGKAAPPATTPPPATAAAAPPAVAPPPVALAPASALATDPAGSSLLEPPPERADDPPMFVKARPEAATTARPIYKRWWFWTALAGVAAAGVTTAVLVSGADRGPATPMGRLPPIDWR